MQENRNHRHVAIAVAALIVIVNLSLQSVTVEHLMSYDLGTAMYVFGGGNGVIALGFLLMGKKPISAPRMAIGIAFAISALAAIPVAGLTILSAFAGHCC